MSLSHFAPDLHLQGQLQQNRGGLEVRRGQKLVKRLTGSHVVRLQSHEFSGRENVGGKQLVLCLPMGLEETEVYGYHRIKASSDVWWKR